MYRDLSFFPDDAEDIISWDGLAAGSYLVVQ